LKENKKMETRRKIIKNTIEIIFKTTLSSAVFLVSLVSVPTLQALWQESGVLDTAYDNIASNALSKEKYAVIGDSIISIEVADSAKERKIGLSDHTELENNSGMFFIFDKSDYHGIWMKDMDFAIDIIWINEVMEIVYIEENVTPDTYPEVFVTDKKSLYVLEVPAGYVKKEGIKISDWVSLF
jgi:uncharacterized membrane protein (UPF0127 family)